MKFKNSRKRGKKLKRTEQNIFHESEKEGTLTETKKVEWQNIINQSKLTEFWLSTLFSFIIFLIIWWYRIIQISNMPILRKILFSMIIFCIIFLIIWWVIHFIISRKFSDIKVNILLSISTILAPILLIVRLLILLIGYIVPVLLIIRYIDSFILWIILSVLYIVIYSRILDSLWFNKYYKS